MRKKLCFETGQLGNMDEVPLRFDAPSNKTMDVKGAKTVMIRTSGNEKTRYTVVLAFCADGTKLPTLLIFKRKTLPKDIIPHGIYVDVHSKGWMDGEAVADFQLQLSYELWDDVFGNNNVNGIFNNFLNTYLRCYYSTFTKK